MLVALLVLGLLIGAGAAVVIGTVGRSDDRRSGATPTSVVATSPPSSAPPTTVPPDELVSVGEVWLLDLGDQRYDWGLTVLTPDGSPTRSGVEATVRLVAAGDEVVYETTEVLDGISARSPVAVAGRVVAPDRPPVRIEFDIGVGVVSDDPGLDVLLATRALERDGDELSGRIRSASGEDVDDLEIVFVWRGETEGTDGDVVASYVHEVERVRAGVDARFEIDLSDEVVPDGPPDDVLWSP